LEGKVAKLVVMRLALSGALVAVSALHLMGLAGGLSEQVVVGGVVAAAVAALKLGDVI
jgi:hypothetical protein